MMNTTIAQHNAKNPISSKKPIAKRTIPLEEPKPTDEKSLTSNRYLNIKATLRSANTATFLNENDYFYKYLSQRHKEHKHFISLDDDTPSKYNQSYSVSGFKFKTYKPYVFYDERGQMCIPDSLYDKVCTFYLQVIPYKYKEQAGLVIRVSSVTLCK